MAAPETDKIFRQFTGDDPFGPQKTLDTIQKFLDTYPSVISPDDKADAPFLALSLGEVYRRTLQTAIDIIHDISLVVTNKDTMSKATFRRRLFEAFTRPERRFYVGVWLIITSFVLYFIDSAA